MNKKLVALALGLTVLIMLGGIQTSFLYGTTFLNMKPGYTFSVAATSAWWDCNWSYAKKITIDHTKVQADQTNFPVLLYEGSDADLADYAQDNGNDIVFVDQWNLSQYNHELEKFDGDTGELWAWVKVASLSSTSDTILYMYYGNPDCVNQENVTGIWDSSYEMVQHLDETSGATFDSTIHHNDGTPQGGITQNVAGKIDGADSFDGSDAAISCRTSESLNVTSQVTVEAWVQDPPYTKQGTPQRAHVRIVDKRNETVPLRSLHPFTVGRRITVDCDAEAIVVFLHSPGVIINEVTVAHTSVLVKKYQAGVPTSPEEQRIETIRQQLPEELTTLSTVVYSTSFSLQGGTIYPLEINVESSNPLSINGRISYLVIAADGSYDYEGSTRWILPVGFIDPRISISILNRIFDFFTKKDSAHSEYGYGKKSQHILEAGGGTIAGDAVFWENLYGRLAVYPHTSNELAKHTQYVNLTWHEMDTNIDIVFGFNEILKDYDIWMWQNMSHDVKVSDYGDMLANYTLDNITSFTVLGETPKDVDYGEVPSGCYANVIIDSGDLTYNLTIAFDRYEWLNSGHTACYFECTYYDIIGFHYEEQYWYGWKGIRNLFTHREYGGKHYYYVSNIPVKQGSTYCFKCQYTVPPNSRGKWELLAKLHTDTLEEALSSGRYVMVDPWWNGGWSCYQLITIESDYIDEPLTNFPVLVVINSTVGAKCDGGNSIRFLSTDNITEFNYEIEFWNSSDSSYVWVNISEQIPSSSDYTFLMYYNNSVASDNQNPTGVWDSNFTAVWHLNETSGTVFDSTSNNHDSSSVIGVTQDATGKIDGGDSFDGSSDYIDITMTLPSTVTISAWATYSIGASNGMLWCIDSDNQGPDLFFGVPGSGVIALNTWDSWNNPFCNVPADANQWHLYTTVIESGNTKLYINDSLGGTANYRNPTGSDFHISSSAGYDWTGIIDEVRISNMARNTSWINATYHTMNQTTDFLTWGGEIERATITWDGSESSVWTLADNWLGGVVPSPIDDVIIDGNYTNAPVISSDVTIYSLKIGENNASVLSFTQDTPANLTVTNNITVYANGTITITRSSTTGNGRGRTITAGNIDIKSGGKINADGKGFAGGSGSADGSGPGGGDSQTNAATGGSYGGIAGNARYTSGYTLASAPATYGTAASPTALGSGGGAYYSGSVGGTGGGAIKLSISGTLTVNGTLSATGSNGVSPTYNVAAGGGSGGSIWIMGGGTLKGTGTIIAKGGDGSSTGTSYRHNSGGGGGRIDISGITISGSTFLTGGGTLSIISGTCYGRTTLSKAGTIKFPSSLDLVIDNSGSTGLKNLTLGVNVESDSVDETLYNFNSVTVKANSTLTLSGNSQIVNGGSASNPYGQGVTITAANIDIQANGTISADGEGFGRWLTSGGTSFNGPGPGGGDYSTRAGAGGGYGGTGGNATYPGYSTASGGSYYGPSTTPTILGSGGGVFYDVVGGSGGGGIKLAVSGTLTVNGTLSSRGTNASGSEAAGGGSGGSIYLSIGSTIAGTGTISANGGNGGGSFARGGGGGGRIHCIYTTDNFTSGGTKSYAGGTGAGGGTGGAAGTLIWETNAKPTVITDLTAATKTDTTGAVTLTWTAPYANSDNTGGAVTSYDVRYSTTARTYTADIDDTWWNAATEATGEPGTPAAPTTAESMTVSGLTAGTRYYFAIKSSDGTNTSYIDTKSQLGGTSQANAVAINSGWKVWQGDESTAWATAGNWLGGAVPTTGDTVTFIVTYNTNCAVATVPTGLASIRLEDGYTGTVTFSNANDNAADTLTLTGDLVANGGYLVLSGEADGNPTEGAGYILNVANITVGASGSINADGKGFAAGAGPGKGAYPDGASHGGRNGDALTVGNTVATYGSFTNPTSLGSGSSYSAGGGAIIISASGTVTVNGTLSAKGSSNAIYSAGSGGSLNITASTLAGSGTISANGGNAGGSYGSGGGGRISLNGVTTDNFTGILQANGGSTAYPAYAGTIYLNPTKRTSSWTITNGQTYRLGSDDLNNYTFGAITIQSGGTLEIDGNPGLNSGNGGAATLNIASIDVQSGGTLSATGLGFRSATGPGTTGWPGGCSYGGKGGLVSSQQGLVYGSLTNPIYLGSGRAGSGGGAIIISASGTVTVNGTVTAEGASLSSGSGGSINITAATLAGSGTIKANGGTASAGSHGDGGGGRIAITQTTGTSWTPTVQAFGAAGGYAAKGAAGTIYKEDATDGSGNGELIVNNNGVSTSATTNISSSVTGTSVGNVTIQNSGILDIAANLTTSDITIASGSTCNITSGGNLTMSGVLTLNGDFNIVNGNAFDVNLSNTKFNLTNGTNVALHTISNTPSDPSGYTNISKYVNLTRIGASSVVDVNISYSDSDLGIVNENSLVMWEYNETTQTWTQASNTGVDTINNYVWANNVTNFSIYGPLGEPNTAPEISNPYPANESTGISPAPMLNITVNDSDGDAMTITWYSNSSGSWQVFGINTSCSNGTYHQTNSNFSNYSITYYWNVSVSDGTDTNNSAIYHFTTEAINTSVDGITPYEVKASSLTITATAEHNNYSNVTLWYRYSSDNSTWWNSSWTYRKKLTIDHNQVTATLTNFPILVSITDSDLSSKAQSDGDDIVFINATGTKLNHEIEHFNGTTGELIAWVNVTSLSGSTDTEIYMYYGNSTCSSQENVAGVWSSKYTAVLHLNSNFNDSVDGNFPTNSPGASLVTGKIGKGADIQVDGDEIDYNTSSALGATVTTGTVEFWMNASEASYDYLVDIGYASGIIAANFDGTTNPYLRTYWNSWIFGPTGVVSRNTWHYVVVRWNSSVGFNMWVDGSYYFDYSGSKAVTVNKVCIGNHIYHGNYESNGILDEVRFVGGTELSNEWINTTFNTTNNTDTFLSVGSEECWMPWNDASNPDESSPWGWDFNFPNGTGYYEFYSIGKKTGSTDETAPGSADASCGYDNIAPSSSVDTIAPYVVASSPLTINATASDALSGVKNVTLWYRYSSGNSSWWNCSWKYRKLITINASQVAGHLSNFPVLIRRSADTGLASKAQDDGDDICFIKYADNSTKYSHELERFDGTTGELWAWVNITSLSNTADTKLWMYYGNPSCGSQQNPAGTWDANYKGVWHFAQATSSLSMGYWTPVDGEPSASSYYFQSNPLYAFDGLTTAQSDVDAWVTNGNPVGWLAFHFNAPTVVSGYKIYPYLPPSYPNRNPKDWKFEGSNDGSSWTTLDTQSSQTSWTSGVGVEYPFSNSNAYSYYRLNISANNGDSGYTGVTELKFYYYGKSNNLSRQDSTINGNNGTALLQNQVAVLGKVDGGASFNSYNRIATPLTTAFNDFSVEIWFKDDGYVSSYERLADKSYTGGFWFGREASNSNSWGGGVQEGGPPYGIFVTLTDGQWHHIASIRSGTTHYVYGDGGAVVNSNTVSSAPLDGTAFVMGDGTTNQRFGGILDEVRISNVARNSSWINTSYLNQKNPSTFLYVGAEEGWMRWNNASDPDTHAPWSWNFTFPNGTGYYQFYSIAYDNATNQESAPGSADAQCRYLPIAIPTVVTNASTGVEETNATVHGYLQNDGGESCTVRFQYGTTTIYGTNTTNQTQSSGSAFQHNVSGLTPGQLYHFRAHANNSAGSDTGDDMMLLTKPNPPTLLTAQTNTSTKTYLTWSKGTGANTTRIQRKTGGYPTSTNDGTTVYNLSGIHTEDTGLTPGITYYYRAWSYSTWNALQQWSDNNSSANTTTKHVPVLSNENPANGSTGVILNTTLLIQVNHNDGYQMNISWYWGITSSCPNFIGSNTTVTNSTYIMSNDGNFSSNSQTYYWRVIVNDGHGEWTNATYHFSTIPPNKQIISKGRDAYALEINPAGTILYGYINGNSVQTSIDTNWHYVSLAYDGSQIKLYKDGNLQNTSSLSGSINTTAYNLLLGQYLSGKLDEVRVSSTARSASWINTTYLNTNSPTTFATFSSPVGVLSTWTYRKKITINHSFVTATLTDFPILIFNASDTTLKTNAQSTGNDILFMSSTVDWITGTWRNKLDYEIEKFDHITGELEAWVRIPTFSSSVDTIIYMYYGNTLCNTSRQNPTGVWDHHYCGVWHLKETGSGVAGEYADSTSKNNDGCGGAGNASQIPSYTSSGRIDGANDFDGVDDYINAGGSSSLNITGSITLEAWVNPDVVTFNRRILQFSSNNTPPSKGYLLGIQAGQLHSILGLKGGVTSEVLTGTIPATTWTYAAVTWNASVLTGYINGGYSSNSSPTAADIDNPNTLFHIGSSTLNTSYFSGILDEVRISNTTRNSSWINTTFNTINKTNSFLQFGRQMVKNVAPTQGSPSPSNGATGQNLNPPLRISVNDTNQDALNVTFRTNASGSWTTIGTNTSVTNGSYQQIPSTINYPGVSYYWSVNVTDGLLWMNATYHFTTVPEVTFDATTSDGWIENSSGSYVTARNASGGSVSASAMNFYVGQKFDPMGYFIYRGFTFFDTSAIPDDATIASATLSLYGEVDASDQDFFLIIQNGQPASPHDPLQSDDYYHGNYSGNGGSLNTTGFSSSGCNNITLNSTGRSWINKTGMTKLCLRSSRDINSVAPTINEYVRIYTSEQGSGYKPKLIVVYTG